MNGPDVLANLREALAQELQAYAPPNMQPLDISPWLAMALLQKAVRRGERDFALQAAATLLLRSPDRFWRRCGVIAFEDVGVADLDTVALVTAALSCKTFRAKLSGEWVVGSYVVERLVEAQKCRAADDLLLVAERHPAYEQSRLRLTYQTTSELLWIVVGSGDLAERALALWNAIGTDRCPSNHLRARKGNPHAVFDELCEAGYPHQIVEIAREGFRRTGQVLCAFLPLLVAMNHGGVAVVEDDQFPPETMYGDLPSWALDMYSREGLQALTHFLEGDSATARWVRKHIPSAQRVKFLGNILFAVEGGLMRRRINWPLANKLRRQVDVECQGQHCPNASQIIALLRADISILNEVRRDVF
ncbi:hypothetical protein [Microbaculum sp. FT89]|uniref:hypothetical protein n=1 Tax=Microbaculum sp. FT89 TaxID=3447298 RepID=UPI003F538EAF